MSAQGATLQRQGMHLPIWPVAALLVVAVATAIGLTVTDDARPAGQATTFEGRTSTAKGIDRSDFVTRVELPASAIAASSAAVRERPAGPFHAAGRAHEVVVGGGASAGTFVTELPGNAASRPGYGDCIHCQQRR